MACDVRRVKIAADGKVIDNAFYTSKDCVKKMSTSRSSALFITTKSFSTFATFLPQESVPKERNANFMITIMNAITHMSTT